MNVNRRIICTILEPYYSANEAAAMARILLCEMFGSSLTDFYLCKDIALSAKEEEKLKDILHRLQNFEPIQYIQGEAPFLGRSFKVAKGVLIPRPETEELVELMLKEVAADARILDMGTGSGCIAISLSKELPRAEVAAWDVSDEALDIARENNRLLQASVSFSHTDLMTYTPRQTGCYDVIVSNPPYVLEKEKEEMEQNVLAWEPETALFVPDDDPLRFYRRIGSLGRQMLVDGGSLYVETNRAYANEVADLFQSQGYVKIRIIRDMSGNNRFIVVER